MPELPDIDAYLHALHGLLSGRRLARFRVLNPFVLRSVEPAPESFEAMEVVSLARLGKRLVLGFAPSAGAPPRSIVIHLMIAGRLQWRQGPASPPRRTDLAILAFDHGALVLTEAGTRRRASITLVSDSRGLAALDPGGVELLDRSLTAAAFSVTLRAQRHTVKRVLTDPRVISGVGNAYADEILHAARLSPLKQAPALSDAECARLLNAAREVLVAWRERLSARYARSFPGPGEMTAFRPEFAAHGRFGHPCPVCGTNIERIVHAENETNYCPSCQTGGKVLADRALSRLLGEDWEEYTRDRGRDQQTGSPVTSTRAKRRRR